MNADTSKDIASGYGRLSVQLPASVLLEIKGLAEKEQVTVTELVRRAMKTEKFMREQHDAGNEILIREKGNSDSMKRVVFFV